MKITVRGLYGEYGKNPIFEETMDADTADIQNLAESYAQRREGINLLEFESPEEPDESKRYFRFGIVGVMVVSLGRNEYIGTPEDLDALGIPRAHTVISPGFGNKSKPPDKSETKPSQTGSEPPEPKSKEYAAASVCARRTRAIFWWTVESICFRQCARGTWRESPPKRRRAISAGENNLREDQEPQTIRNLRAAETFLMFAENRPLDLEKRRSCLARMSDKDGCAMQGVDDRGGRQGAHAGGGVGQSV